ncbi:MAG: hypothetical protein KU37_09455 [Sulfuricurvum sp. PC08-66]|nr:MAG: hypothetical protein KU37_09455 [Sulfuricurvum sp. PC08-66]
MNFELYAQAESYLGIGEATQNLHEYYFNLLEEKLPKTLLDIGCGNGGFLQGCKKRGIAAVGIDTSLSMVEKARAKKLTAMHQEIGETVGQYDVITAIFDVVNFIPDESLSIFFEDVARLLPTGGRFICDVNTLFGFSEVAQGELIHEEEHFALLVQAAFDGIRLDTRFSFFQEDENGLYRKSATMLRQYFHTVKRLANASSLQLVREMPIGLYDDEEHDKVLLLFVKS